jgi:hypothetical protein
MGKGAWSSVALAACTVVLALTLPVTASAAPANDNFPGTPVFGPLVSLDADNTGAGEQLGQGELPHAGLVPVHSVWYQWTAPAGVGPTDVLTCGQGSPPTDTHLGVYTGNTVSTLVPVAENDNDERSCLYSGSVSSYVTFTPSALTQYAVAVDSAAVGPFALIIRPHQEPPSGGCLVDGVPAPCFDSEGPSGFRAEALKTCKHKKSKKARKKCRKKAMKLPL